MFSKRDYEGYFQQLAQIEAEMIKAMEGILSDITDEPVRAVLLAILHDEIEHAKLVAQMRELITQSRDF